MTLQEVRNFLDACHEVSRIIAAFPDLPEGLSPRHIKALQAIHELQTDQDLPAGANPPARPDTPAETDLSVGADPQTEAKNEASPGPAPESRVKISDVSDFLGGTRPSVTKLIRELESHGALTKTPDTRDKRIIWLQLTPLGEEYYDFYCLRYHTWLSEVLREIPKKDFEITVRTIWRTRELLRNERPPKP